MKFVWYVLLPTFLVGILTGKIGSALFIFSILSLLYWLLSGDETPNTERRVQITRHQDADLAQRVRALEREVAALQTRLAQLERLSLPASEGDAKSVSKSPIPKSSQTHPFRQPEPVPEPVLANQVADIPATSSASSNIVAASSDARQTVVESDAIPPFIPESAFRQPETPKDTTPNPIVAWFMRGNPLLKTGMVVLFLGLAFLLRYVSSHIPIELKYLAVFGAGVAAIMGGSKLQTKKREYGLALQGFGFAVTYLTSLSALKWHELLPASLVFAVMVSSMAMMAHRAVKQDAKIMAQVAVIGGLATPVLVSDGSGNYLVLFTYLALLNLGVARIAWFKTWRSLNLIGFTGTFGIAATWGANAYTPEHFATVEPFLIYHWLLYTLIACFFARNTLQQEPLSGSLSRIPDNASLERIWRTISAYGMHIGALDSTLLFGTALTAFGLQYQMVNHWGNAAAGSALMFAVVYAGFAYYFAKQETAFAVIKQAFMALTLAFITLAIPLALEGQWTASAWALEAALVYAFGLAQRQPQTRLAALAVFGLAAIRQFSSLAWGEETLLHGSIFGTLLAIVSGVGMYYAWHTVRREQSALWEHHAQQTVLVLSLLHAISLPMLLWGKFGTGMALTVYALAFAALQFKRQNVVLSVFVLLCNVIVLYCWSFFHTDLSITLRRSLLLISGLIWISSAYLLHKASWQPEKSSNSINSIIGWIALIFGMILAISSVSTLFYLPNYWHFVCILPPVAVLAKRLHWQQGVQAAMIGALAWVIYVISPSTLWKQDHWFSGSLQMIVATALVVYALRVLRHQAWHGLGVGALLLAWSIWFTDLGYAFFPDTVWAQLMCLFVPMLAWWAIYQTRNSDYVQQYQTVYWQIASPILAAYALCWVLLTNWQTPQPSGLPYVPLLNPLELASAAVVWQLVRWLGAWLPEKPWDSDLVRMAKAVPFALAWLVITAAVMRLWHIYGDVNWRLGDLLASLGLQASLSIVWALTAIALMVRGNQRQQRPLWLVGASLMGVVVAKLFFVELGNSGSVARIVSFIVVGLLLLLVGWFAPAPPKHIDDVNDES